MTHRRRVGDGARRSIAGRHRRDRRRTRRRVSGPRRVVHRTGPRGLGVSYRDGFRRRSRATADFVCQMDADLSHDPKYLPDMIAMAVAGRRPGDRLALSQRHQRRELAAAAHHPQSVRQLLRPHHHRPWLAGQHRRLPLLAPRGAGEAAARSHRLRRVLVPRRSDVHGRSRRSAIGESPIIFVERRVGASKMSGSVMLESLITPWKLILRHGRIRSPRSGGSK